MLSMIQATLRTQQITLASGKSASSAGSRAHQTRLVSKMTALSGLRPVVALEQAGQQVLALRLVDEERGLVAAAHRIQHDAEQRAHRARHRRVKSSSGSAAGCRRAASSPSAGRPEMKWQAGGRLGHRRHR
jgi:hypothetical protein